MGVVGLYWEENIVFCPVRDSMLVENGVYFTVARPVRDGMWRASTESYSVPDETGKGWRGSYFLPTFCP
ncbi:MAG: hypothetical protein LBG15_05110 [Dysgonamonadaceae bacterium]|nr:hypothetical protein [Dysgonamonadaceae bacterium]